ncbi:Detected protein of unknown function [Hibiscus syriacus]|uniref:Reverse transcriptase Ty1/copia-type domain-containing protein n=1 Tax=Hibiscus syriacus TaxID=106335 RepID=A0A6A2ZB00_HIBSY|nr:Detected protein of unknown function [Hibiscus syriacus]
MLPRSKYGIFKPKVFVSSLDKSFHASIDEAMKSKEYEEVVRAELTALQNNGTWSLVKLPEGLSTVGCKWPDIAFSVNKVAQYMYAPREQHLIAAKRILRYLAGTLNYACQLETVMPARASTEEQGQVGLDSDLRIGFRPQIRLVMDNKDGVGNIYGEEEGRGMHIVGMHAHAAHHRHSHSHGQDVRDY